MTLLSVTGVSVNDIFAQDFCSVPSFYEKFPDCSILVKDAKFQRFSRFRISMIISKTIFSDISDLISVEKIHLLIFGLSRVLPRNELIQSASDQIIWIIIICYEL